MWRQVKGAEKFNNGGFTACSLLVTHFELKIAGVDPKKKIEVGSFRVSPTGEQKGLKEIGYARSESHLTEIIEHVCDEAKQYKLVVSEGSYAFHK